MSESSLTFASSFDVEETTVKTSTSSSFAHTGGKLRGEGAGIFGYWSGDYTQFLVFKGNKKKGMNHKKQSP